MLHQQNKKLKILVVSQYYYPEPFRITEICECLVKKGHSIDVLTSVPNVPAGKFYDGYGWFKYGEKSHNGVNIERVNVIRRGTESSIRLALNCASFAINSLFHLPKLMKNDYDVIFVFNNSPVSKNLPAKVFSKIKNIPYVIWILDIWPESMYFLLGMKETTNDNLFKKISRFVSRFLYKSASTILISSKDFLGKLRNMKLDMPIHYFPNFAEKPKQTVFEITREQLGFSKNDFVIGFSGNVGKAQGLDKTIIASTLQTSSPAKWLIVGDGPELETLKALCKKLSVEQNFVFTGWINSENLPAYLSVCDTLLVPLKDNEVLNYTVPAKLQTYMYAQKPVIAFLNGAGAELVEQCDCGVVAKAEDEQSLCDAIIKIKSLSPERLAEMGQNGKEYCEQHFDRDQLIDKLVFYLEKTIEEFRKL